MKKRSFGRTSDGRLVEAVTLESADAAVTIIGWGASVADWQIDGPNGSLPMVLGFPTVEGFERHARGHGAICGRVANRIAGAAFTLDGTLHTLVPNEGPNQLHGGPGGLSYSVWALETDSANDTVRLTFDSPDGDQGFPGAVHFSATFRLRGPKLTCEMEGLPTRTTPINLANHTYYNLGGGGTVKDHVMWIDADAYTVLKPDLIPTGEIRAIDDSDFDFRVPREIGDVALDQNVVLRPDRDVTAPSARVECPRTGAVLELWTAEPGLQLFNASSMTIGGPGLDGASYGPYAGLCLEAQHFPDSVNHPDWPSTLRGPDHPYRQKLDVAIARPR